MDEHVHIHIHPSERTQRQLDRMESLLRSVIKKEAVMSAELDALTAQVEATVGTEASAIAAINGLAQKVADLAASGGTPAQFTALAAEMKTSADALAAAIPATPTA